MNFFHYVYKSLHLQWQQKQLEMNTSNRVIVPPLREMLQSKAVFLWVLTELQDYFKDGDVRSAHVLSINNVGLGDRALSFRRLGSVARDEVGCDLAIGYSMCFIIIKRL